MHYSTSTRFSSAFVFALLLLAGALTAGCDVLEVDNPNNLVEEDLGNPAAAPAIANGALSTVTEGIGTVLGPYSAATDELTWTGTRDAWEQLVFGEVDDPLNEFSDDAFGEIAEARWTADEAIERLEAFQEEGRLSSTQPLIRSYVYGALAYITIADVFEDFALSDRQEAAPPVGTENMDSFYETAVQYLDEAVALARQNGHSDWETRALAVRARAHYSYGLWQKLNPLDVGDPLVQSDAATSDAKAVLGRIGEEGWSYELDVEPGTPENSMAANVNERLELRIGDAYVVPTEDGKEVERVKLKDPIDEVVSPHLRDEIQSFVNANQYVNIPVTSAREMYLILAEDALARDDVSTFQANINKLRRLDGLTEYSGQVPALQLLIHSRRVNLFLHGRRLADHYRFEEPAPEWKNATPGSFFPITVTEIRANPHLDLGS